MMYYVYEDLYMKNSNTASQKFFASMASFTSTYRGLTFNMSGETYSSESKLLKDFKKVIEDNLAELCLTQKDVKQAIKDFQNEIWNQHTVSGFFSGDSYYGDATGENYGRKFALWNQFGEKGDFTHMAATVAIMLNDLNPVLDYIGSEAGYYLFNGNFSISENVGYAGDIFGIMDEPKLNPGDYKADLDSPNISQRIKDNGDSNLLQIFTEYYDEVNSDSELRANEFLGNVGNSYLQGVDYIKEQKRMWEIWYDNRIWHKPSASNSYNYYDKLISQIFINNLEDRNDSLIWP